MVYSWKIAFLCGVISRTLVEWYKHFTGPQSGSQLSYHTRWGYIGEVRITFRPACIL